MRDPDQCQPHHNRAVLAITPAFYDRRALDTRADYALFTSLTHLGTLVQSSPKVRDALVSDGGIERLVRILQEGKLKRRLEPWQSRKWQQALLDLVYLAARGSEHVRRRLVEAGIIPVLVTVLCHALEDLASHADAYRSAMKKLQQRQASNQARRVEMPVVQTQATTGALADIQQRWGQQRATAAVEAATAGPAGRPRRQSVGASTPARIFTPSRTASQQRLVLVQRRNSAAAALVAHTEQPQQPVDTDSPLRPPAPIQQNESSRHVRSEADYAFGRHPRVGAVAALTAQPVDPTVAREVSSSTTSRSRETSVSREVPPARPTVTATRPASTILDSRLRPMDDLSGPREIQRRQSVVATTTAQQARPSRLSSIYRNPTASESEDAVVTTPRASVSPERTSRSASASPAPVLRLQQEAAVGTSTDGATTPTLTRQAGSRAMSPAPIRRIAAMESISTDTTLPTAPHPPVLPEVARLFDRFGVTDTFHVTEDTPAPAPPTGDTATAPVAMAAIANEELLRAASVDAQPGMALPTTTPATTATATTTAGATLPARDTVPQRAPASYDMDVVWCLRILTYLTKYPNLRSQFSGAHDVPSLRRNLKQFEYVTKQETTGLPTPINPQQRFEQMDEDLSDSLRLPYNLFSIVEKFTMPINTQDATYWAAVVMRNTCRKDLERGGIRQCAHLECGKWETKDKQFAKCRRCRRAKYCSKQCQSKAWTGHKWWCEISSKDQEQEIETATTESERLAREQQLINAQA